MHKYHLLSYRKHFSGGSVVKNPPINVGDMGSIPGLGRSPGKGNGNQLQYSFFLFTPVFLPEKSHGQRSLQVDYRRLQVDCSPVVSKSLYVA